MSPCCGHGHWGSRHIVFMRLHILSSCEEACWCHHTFNYVWFSHYDPILTICCPNRHESNVLRFSKLRVQYLENKTTRAFCKSGSTFEYCTLHSEHCQTSLTCPQSACEVRTRAARIMAQTIQFTLHCSHQPSLWLSHTICRYLHKMGCKVYIKISK